MTRIKHILIGRNPVKTLVRATLLVLIAFIVFGFIVRPVRVRGISMEPTLSDGTIHFVNLIKYRWFEPKRGDTVAIAMPGGRAFYMKRILALPGETIAFDDGVLLINGSVLPEPYLRDQGDWTLLSTEVPEGQYFVAGDNRLTLFDSHTLGLVERQKMEGVLLK